MAKVKTGDYFVRVYDKYGTPMRELDNGTLDSLTAADAYGVQVLAEREDAHSYTADMRVRNSLDNSNRW